MEIFLNGGSLAGTVKPAKNSTLKTKKGKARGRGAKQEVETIIEEGNLHFII